MMTKREKDLTVQLLVEKLQRISGKKVVLKEDVASGVDNPAITTDKNGEAKLNVTEDITRQLPLYLKADIKKELPLTREEFNALVRNKKTLLGDINGSEGEYGDWSSECFWNYYYTDNPGAPEFTSEQKTLINKIWEL